MADPYTASRGDLLTTAFWEHLAGGEFVVQRCGQCGRTRFPPTAFCPGCHSLDYRWLPVGGEGTLWSVTTVRVAPSPALAPEVPYRLAVVELAEGPLVLARIERVDGEPAIGTVLRLVIDPRPEGPQYHFEPA